MKRIIVLSAAILFSFSALSMWISTTARVELTPESAGSHSHASAVNPVQRGSRSLDDFDIRANLSRTLPILPDDPSIAPTKLQNRVAGVRQSGLLRQRPSAEIKLSSLTGTPSRIISFQQPLSDHNNADAAVAARQFIRSNSDLFRLNNAEIDQLKVARRYQTQVTGLTHLTFQQQIDGIDLFQCEYSIHLDRNGVVIAASGELMPEASKFANPGSLRLSAFESLQRAAGYADVEMTGSMRLRKQPAGRNLAQSFRKEDGRKANGGQVFAEDVEARLVYFPLSADQVRLAWEFILWKQETSDTYLIVVDAERGSLLYRYNLTWNCFDRSETFSYGMFGSAGSHWLRYFTAPSGPAHSGQTPRGLVFTKESPRPNLPQTGSNPPVVNREELQFQPATFNGATIFNAGAPHLDWWDGQPATGLTSNNTDVYLDRNSDNQPDLPRLTAADGNFTFPIDFTLQPTTEDNQKAAQANLFYWMNRYHDILYLFGFNEAAGNFQTNNFGLGGTGGDAIRAEAQDGSGANNANYSGGRDGTTARIQMFLWTTANPQLDGDLDQGIIIHEATHGLSTRLVGNGTGLAGMQSRGMGEGWSDYFSLALLREEADNLDGSYAVGQYALNNYTRGIRRFPYSTNPQVYPYNFGDISRSTQVHAVGEIWCNTLMEMRAQLIRRHGYREGQRQSIQLVVDGLKLTPINPTFLDARNAILLADKVNNGSANQCLIWQAFSKRGMGFSASAIDSSDGSPAESFDMPPSCSDLGSIRFDQKTYLSGETMKVSVGDRNATGAIRVNIRSSVTNDQETITAGPDAVLAGLYSGNLRVVAGRANPGDGSLQASLQAGDKIIATYDDANTGSGNSAQVTAQVDVVGESTFFNDDVESGNRGWSVVGRPASTWAIISTRSASPAQSWTDSPAGNYVNNTDTSLVSPLFDLSRAGGVLLSIAHSYDLERGFDYGIVEYSTDDGATWRRATAFTGPQTTFTQARVNLDTLAGQSRARIRFRMTTDTSATGDGWTIDDIRLITRTSDLRLLPPPDAFAPMITSVAPAFGAPGGNTSVIVTGANFTDSGDVRVLFDGIPATNVRVFGATALAALTPPHGAGAVTLRVETRYGAATFANAFTYFVNGSVTSAPSLMNIFPLSGSSKGGTAVTIYGTNFTPQTAVTFGTQSAAVTFINSNIVRAVAPASPNNATGAVDVAAANPQSTQARLTGGYSYTAPTPPTVAVLSPGAGDTVYTGSTITLRWRSSDNRAVARHRIALYRSTTTTPSLIASIADAPGEAQSFNWTIPITGALTTAARIRVLAIDDEGAETEAFSTGDFAIDRRWISSPGLPAALNRMAATTDGQFLYTLGGRSSTANSTSVATVQRLDPSLNSPVWSSEGIAPLPVALNAIEAATINGKIYIPGGFTAQTTIDRSLRIYDIATNTWSAQPPPPTGAGNYAIATDTAQGIIYVTGGSDLAAGISNVQAYDTRTNTWQALPPMKNARFAHEAAFINGMLYVYGGSGPSGGLTSTEVFDFQSGQWSSLASANLARRYAVSAVGRDASGRLLWMIFGGEDAGTGAPVSSAEVYDIASDRWVVLDGSFSLPEARTFFNGVSLGGYLHAVGGAIGATSGTTAVTAHERFNLNGFTLVNPNQPPLVIVPLAQQIAIANQQLKFAVSAQDLGSGAPISITADGLPQGASFNVTNDTNNSARGDFHWTPTPSDVGRNFNVNFIASDGALSDVKSVAIRVVNASPLTAVNAANFGLGPLAADSIASAFGTSMAARVEIAQSLPLPLSLAGTAMTVNGIPAPLFFVSPTQINFVVPSGVDPGTATIVVSSPMGVYSLGNVEITQSAPAIFTADATGRGDAAALATIDGVNYQRPPFDVLVNGRPNILVLYATGIRRAPASDPADDNGVAESVTVTIDGRLARVLYAGAQGGFAGLDQINAEMPAALAGGGQRRVEVAVTVNGVAANRVTIQLK
jgi:uncharacterized protein (TIGR03437 family)